MFNFVLRDVGGQTAYTPLLKQNPLLVPAIIAGVSALAGAGSQIATNKANIRNQNFLWNEQNARQDFLNANGALIKRQSMDKAGLNVNSDYGYSPNVTANVPTSAQQQAPQLDMSTLAQLVQQAPLVDAQAKKTKEEARNLKIQNDREETVDNNLDTYFHDWFSKHVDANENVIFGKYQHYNKGTLDAQKFAKEWETRSKELDALDVKYQIDKLVYDKQLADSPTIDAIADMPRQAQAKLYNEVLNLAKDNEVMQSVIALNTANKDKAEVEKDFIKFQKQMAEKSNVHALIDKYLPDSSLGDFAHFMAILLSSLTGRVSASYSIH